jgi:starch phosphorylase
LDGWWDEAYTPEVGWAIGRRETYPDQNYQDQVEADALYGILEQEVVPMFYDRVADGLPRRWIQRMKTSISQLCRFFTTHRMVGEYTTRFYLPCALHQRRSTEDGMARVKALAAWRAHVAAKWPQIGVSSVSADHITPVTVGTGFAVKAEIQLGELTPDDVSVELFLGTITADGNILGGRRIPMPLEKSEKQGTATYAAENVTCPGSGMYGYTVRVLPNHQDLMTSFVPGMITCA